jgi:hypothetical protein
MQAAFCITTEEDSLISMINAFRTSQGLAPLAPSKSLSYVAHVHSLDLYYHHPDRTPCGLHSWSDHGRWTACCFSDKEVKYACMWNKPKELTNYRGKGYELTFMKNEAVGPQEPFSMWTTHEVSSDILLNKGKWKMRNWKSIGTAIYRGYALVWFGEEADPSGAPAICHDDGASQTATVNPPSTTQNKTGGRNTFYYLIIASYDTWDKAKSVADQYKTMGYHATEIIYGDKKYRVALETCTTITEAKKELNKLSDKVSGLWILQK